MKTANPSMNNLNPMKLISLCGLVLFGCGKPLSDHNSLATPSQITIEQTTSGLIGGPVVSKSTHPWSESVFLLMIATPVGSATCTASLIGPSILLTAGHCVSMLEGQELQAPEIDKATGQLSLNKLPFILALSQDRQSGGIIAQSLLHPEYKDFGGGSVKADIALLRLASPIEVKNKLKFDRSGLGNYGGRGFAAGFGINKKSNGFLGWGAEQSLDYQLRTRKFQISKVSDTQIDPRADISRSFLIDNLRDAEDEGGICQGDSGGPFLRGNKTDIVAGVISRSSGGCFSTAIATRVSDFKSWIEASAKKWGLSLN